MKKIEYLPNGKFTCPASRHAYKIGAAIVKGRRYPMIQESPEHCGDSIIATVLALWDAREEIDRLKSELAERKYAS